MQYRRRTRPTIMLILLLLGTAAAVNGAGNLAGSAITIGGVVFTDLHDPIRSGVQGVTVTIEGDGGTFEVTTGGVIGLWKIDVPEGTYIVTPKKKGYIIEHFAGVSAASQRSITIDATPANMAANQSIRFLAMEWPEEENGKDREVPAETPDTGRTGGGCAMVHGSQSKIADFVAPYAACFCVLLLVTRIDSRKQRPRDK
jgi:hypothetical protein